MLLTFSRLPAVLRQVFFPASCIICGAPSGAFCIDCAPAVSEHRLVRLAADADQPQSLFPWTIHAVGNYDGHLREAVLAFKTGRRDVGDALAGFMATRFHRLLQRRLRRSDNPPMLVPIPTTVARRRERGFDGALFLASAIAADTGLPLVPVLRQGAGDTQRGRNRRQRLAAAGRFTPWRASVVNRRDVILVDDVVTTGATLRDAARTLANCGARITGALVLAYSEGPTTVA